MVGECKDEGFGDGVCGVEPVEGSIKSSFKNSTVFLLQSFNLPEQSENIFIE